MMLCQEWEENIFILLPIFKLLVNAETCFRFGFQPKQIDHFLDTNFEPVKFSLRNEPIKLTSSLQLKADMEVHLNLTSNQNRFHLPLKSPSIYIFSHRLVPICILFRIFTSIFRVTSTNLVTAKDR